MRGALACAVAAAALILAACGTDATSGSDATLESWRDAACAVFQSQSEAMEPPESQGDAPVSFADGEASRTAAALDELVAKLRAIPVPETSRPEITRLVEAFAEYAAGYKKALPRIEAASRRLERAMKSLKAGNLPPPPKEPTTVAGGIMTQMMGDPEFAAAFAELMAAYDAAAPSFDEHEVEQLGKELGIDKCVGEPEAEDERLTEEELAVCGARGAPVTLSRLVEVFRENGITLDIQEDVCGKPEEKQVPGFDSDATNTGPDGFDDSNTRDEGHVMCDVGDEGSGRIVEANKYPTDTETRMLVLNIACTIYPDSTASEAVQVARLRKAMEAVADSAP